jgi:pimeloyl-ACP methyl ester carboxylesterase
MLILIALRAPLLIIVLALGPATSALAQASGPELLWKRDYAFERLEATRVVKDADDNGTIRLVTQVWRPLKNDRREVVFFSHGSTGALAVSPIEPAGDGPPRGLVGFFLSRGYTIVWPFRRGRGQSTGTYIEECATLIGECTPAQQLALTDRGLASALADNYAVMDQLVLGNMVAKDARVLLVGQSRGGFLSLVMAGERPAQVKGVINFAGGWQSMQPRLSAEDIRQRLEIQAGPLTRAARKSAAPTLWIYAARDPNYVDGAPRDLHRIWLEGGGKGEYFFIEQHTLPNPHLVLQNPALWSTQVETFLKGLDVPTGR